MTSTAGMADSWRVRGLAASWLLAAHTSLSVGFARFLLGCVLPEGSLRLPAGLGPGSLTGLAECAASRIAWLLRGLAWRSRLVLCAATGAAAPVCSPPCRAHQPYQTVHLCWSLLASLSSPTLSSSCCSGSRQTGTPGPRRTGCCLPPAPRALQAGEPSACAPGRRARSAQWYSCQSRVLMVCESSDQQQRTSWVSTLRRQAFLPFLEVLASTMASRVPCKDWCPAACCCALCCAEHCVQSFG